VSYLSKDPVVLRQQPGCLIQILWFVFIGFWLGALAIGVAYVLLLLVVTIPVGIALLNRVPQLIALRQPDRLVTAYGEVKVRQHNFFLRALWFLFVGWWLAAGGLAVAYLLCASILGMPLGFLIFDWVPGMLTLRRS